MVRTSTYWLAGFGIFAGTILLTVHSATINAQDIATSCVTCSSPSRTYTCEVLLPDDGVMTQSPQLFCASELAAINGHKSCLVARNVGAACEGERVTLAYTGPITDPVPVEIAPTTAESAQETQPPKTLVEATGRAVKSTNKQIQKAGKAIGDAGKAVGSATLETGRKIKDTTKSIGETVGGTAKSTWECLASFFQSC